MEIHVIECEGVPVLERGYCTARSVVAVTSRLRSLTGLLV